MKFIVPISGLLYWLGVVKENLRFLFSVLDGTINLVCGWWVVDLDNNLISNNIHKTSCYEL